VIPEGTSGTEQITDTVTRLGQAADTTLQNMNRVLGAENQKAFAELLVQLRDLARGLNERLATVDRVAVDIGASAAAFRKATGEISVAARRVADAAEPLSRDAGGALREATTALQALTQATRNVERDLTLALQRIDKDGGAVLKRADDALDIGVLELRATAAELRGSAESVARTLDRLREPRAALLGPGRDQLGPGEDRP
jgi:phospholipid/cholesterol/gamma-HCH transport system substrate-binding protein